MTTPKYTTKAVWYCGATESTAKTGQRSSKEWNGGYQNAGKENSGETVKGHPNPMKWPDLMAQEEKSGE